jgi:threonine/homoserine/homoserine lactone efflux protein
VDHLLALVGFSFVSSITPGPNNVLLWASGATFGFRRTLPHVVGTAIGLGAMALAVAAGLGVLITTVPGLALAMKIGGSAYLLYLAWHVARAGTLERGAAARPLTLLQAAAFQAINPKAWIFALGAITTFRPTDLPLATGTLVVALTMMLVILPAAAAWGIGGDALSRLMADEGTSRRVAVALGLTIAATVVLVWI